MISIRGPKVLVLDQKDFYFGVGQVLVTVKSVLHMSTADKVLVFENAGKKLSILGNKYHKKSNVIMVDKYSVLRTWFNKKLREGEKIRSI